MSDNKIELSGIFSEGYGFVPKKLMRAKDISATTKNILCYLLSFTGAGVTCFPQIQDIATDLGITTRTVIRSINAATKSGYLKKHQENRGRGIGKKNSYELLFMYDFSVKNHVTKHVTKKSPDKVSCDTTALSCDKIDNYHVTPGQSNNNNIKSNSNNNNNAEFNYLDSLFKNNNPNYYRDAKQSSFLKKLVTRFKTQERLTEVFDAFRIKIMGTDKWFSQLPLTPSAMYSNIDSCLKEKQSVYKDLDTPEKRSARAEEIRKIADGEI